MQIGGLFIIINSWQKSWIPIVVRDGMEIEFYKCNVKKLVTIINKGDDADDEINASLNKV